MSWAGGSETVQYGATQNMIRLYTYLLLEISITIYRPWLTTSKFGKRKPQARRWKKTKQNRTEDDHIKS